jgi:hypothetical protein
VCVCVCVEREYFLLYNFVSLKDTKNNIENALNTTYF